GTNNGTINTTNNNNTTNTTNNNTTNNNTTNNNTTNNNTTNNTTNNNTTNNTTNNNTTNNITNKNGLDEKETHRRIEEANKPLTEQFEKLAQQIAREKGIPVAPLRVILNKLGQTQIGDDDDISRRFNEMADELLKLRQEVARAGQSPGLASLSEQTQE